MSSKKASNSARKAKAEGEASSKKSKRKAEKEEDEEATSAAAQSKEARSPRKGKKKSARDGKKEKTKHVDNESPDKVLPEKAREKETEKEDNDDKGDGGKKVKQKKKAKSKTPRATDDQDSEKATDKASSDRGHTQKSKEPSSPKAKKKTKKSEAGQAPSSARKKRKKVELPEGENVQDFVKKLASTADLDFEGSERGPAPPKPSLIDPSPGLDSIELALKALAEWDIEDSDREVKSRKADGPNKGGSDKEKEAEADGLDSLLDEMAKGMLDLGQTSSKQKEEEEKQKKKEEEEKQRREEEEVARKKRQEEEEARKRKEEEEVARKKKEEEEARKRKEEEDKKKKEDDERNKKAVPAGIAAIAKEGAGKFTTVRLDNNNKGQEKEDDDEDLPLVDRVRKEFIETETTYVEGLGIIMRMYYRPLEVSGLIRQKDIDTIFYGVDQIHSIHSTLLNDLVAAERKAATGGASAAFAAVLQRFVPFLKIYTEYINHYDDANKRLYKLRQKEKKFAAFLKECQAKPECKSLDIASYLISPIQRLPRYELLLRDYMKHSKDEKERKQIEALFNAVVDVNKHINQRKADSEVRKKKYKLQAVLKQHKLDLFSRTDREFIKEGALQICEIVDKDVKEIVASDGAMKITQSVSSRKLAKKNHTSFKENYFFLFDDVLIQVMLVPTEEDREFNYKYVRHYSVFSITVENVNLNSPAVGVLLDPVDETAKALLMTWLTTEKSTEGELDLDTPSASPSSAREQSTRLYMRRFYLKAATVEDRNEWKNAIEKHAAGNVDGIIDNKVRRGTLKLPEAPSSISGLLPSSPEEMKAYKDQMKRKYEEEQQKMRLEQQLRGEQILSTLESRMPVMDVFKNSTTTSTATSLSARAPNVRVHSRDDLKSHMELLDKEMASWESKRNTWGRTSSGPYATRTLPPTRPISPRSNPLAVVAPAVSSTTTTKETANVDNMELADLLKALDSEVKSFQGGSARSPSPSPMPFQSSPLARTSSLTSLSGGSGGMAVAEGSRVAELERMKREKEEKMLEMQRDAERLERELELEKQREREAEAERLRVKEREAHESVERVRREEARRAAGGGLVCEFCLGSLAGEAYVQVDDKAYHPHHFNCTICGIGLAGQPYFPVGHDKKPHCPSCYNRRRNVAKCHGCQQEIIGEYVVVFDKNWHQDCLQCMNCGVRFSTVDTRADPGKRMMAKDDEPICKSCFGRTWNQGRKCHRCKLAVSDMSQAKTSPSLDRCWHKECLICDSCSQPISDGRWKDNRPFCDLHY